MIAARATVLLTLYPATNWIGQATPMLRFRGPDLGNKPRCGSPTSPNNLIFSLFHPIECSPVLLQYYTYHWRMST
ncbi:hypothetical protein F4860DRAFT_468339 [Xylaria cubensis]|nr:hypothetical protein F4860DRAFT_468339 [Xylaria cubensis]